LLMSSSITPIVIKRYFRCTCYKLLGALLNTNGKVVKAPSILQCLFPSSAFRVRAVHGNHVLLYHEAILSPPYQQQSTAAARTASSSGLRNTIHDNLSALEPRYLQHSPPINFDQTTIPTLQNLLALHVLPIRPRERDQLACRWPLRQEQQWHEHRSASVVDAIICPRPTIWR
jgi:hypothetical protein